MVPVSLVLQLAFARALQAMLLAYDEAFSKSAAHSFLSSNGAGQPSDSAAASFFDTNDSGPKEGAVCDDLRCGKKGRFSFS